MIFNQLLTVTYFHPPKFRGVSKVPKLAFRGVFPKSRLIRGGLLLGGLTFYRGVCQLLQRIFIFFFVIEKLINDNLDHSV